MAVTLRKVVGKESITSDPFGLSDTWIIIADILPQIAEIG
jgi:hypothetical protein